MGFFWQKYIILYEPSVCIKVRINFTAPMGLPPIAKLPGLPPYYTNAFADHALLSMPVNCL